MEPKLFGRLVRAQREARGVEKTSQNAHHRYKYASAEAVIEEARAALTAAGLAVFAWGWRLEPGAIVGEQRDFDRVVVTYILADEEGHTHTLDPCSTPVIPEKGRPPDKAEATALTYNLGYMLRGLLLLPRVEEGADVDQRDDRNHEPRQREAPAPMSAADVTARTKRLTELAEQGDLDGVNAFAEREVRALWGTIGPAHRKQLAEAITGAREMASTVAAKLDAEAEGEDA